MSNRHAPAWIVGPLLFLCVLAGYLLSYNVDQPTHNGDWYIRYQVTCSIVERNAFDIPRYSPDARIGPGVGGHDYAQYTLGQTTAIIPLYLLGRALAGVSHTDCWNLVPPPIVFLTCKTLDLILGALLCTLFYATARLLRYSTRLSLALSLLLAFGSSLWPDVLSNLEHTMESLFLLAAAYAALRYTLQRRKNRLWVVVMGLAAGLVFVTRVAGVIATPIFALYLLALHRRWRPGAWQRPFRSDLALYAVAALPSYIVNAVYDVLRFGSPWRLEPYPDQTLGFPPWFGIPDLLISPGKGLLWYTPALLLLLPALGPFRRRYPLPAILFGLIGAVYLLFYANVNYWHGDPAWGPRYLYPVLPYLLLPLGEVLRRWRGYRRRVRGLMVGALAASVLVQLVGVTVSYWRYWHYLFGYHVDRIQHHAWGFNFNNFWSPDQSPIAVLLAGVAAITRAYASHAPLLQHPSAQHLSVANETNLFQVFGRASIRVVDADELHVLASSNTFAMWWLHSLPWWSRSTIIYLAAALLALFVLSAAALIGLTRAPRQRRERSSAPAAARASLAQPSRASRRPAGGLAPLGGATLLAVVAFAGVMVVGALGAPRHAAPLVSVVPMNTTIRDGLWTYRVLGVTTRSSLTGAGDPARPGYRYVVIRLQLYNAGARPDRLVPAFYGLADLHGDPYPAVTGPGDIRLDGRAVQAFAADVPAHASAQRLLIYRVPTSAHNVGLLGPGIALVRLVV